MTSIHDIVTARERDLVQPYMIVNYNACKRQEGILIILAMEYLVFIKIDDQNKLELPVYVRFNVLIHILESI